MSQFREQLRAQIEQGKAAFQRLSQREQVMVVGTAALVFVFILVGVGLIVSSAIDKAEHRVRVKTEQLAQVLALQGEYKAREAQRQARMRELGRTNVRLVSVVEDAARQAGVEIGQLKPDEGEPNPEGIVESRVELQARNLSADRLQDFLSRIEKSPGVVIMRRIKVTRPYRKDTVDVDMTITTYHAKS